MNPVVSVVMSVYNGELYLREAVDSILNQTFTDFEFIIIDDGSTDSSAEILQSYRDTRIRLFQQENVGLAVALNKGIARAKGKYIARMDADDMSFLERLGMQYRFMEAHSDILAIGSSAVWIDKDGSHICICRKPAVVKDFKDVLPNTPFIHPAVMYRIDAFFMAGGYPDSFKWGAEDTVLFNKLARLGKLYNLYEPLLYYRLNPEALSRIDRRHLSILKDITRKSVNDVPIDEAEYKSLALAKQATTKDEKIYIYHLLVAEMLLRTGSGSIKARQHLFIAFKYHFWRLRPWIFLFLSFLPSSQVKPLYEFVKKYIAKSANKDIFE